MNKIILVIFSLITLSAHAQMDQFVCGEYKLLRSCGIFQVETPVLVSDKETFSIASWCPAERMELCNLRYSLVKLMISGKKYCVGGIIDRNYESPCADDSILINRVDEIP